jgi:acid phosphatase type 7
VRRALWIVCLTLLAVASTGTAAAAAAAVVTTMAARPRADAYVNAARPHRNFGHSRALRAGGEPRTRSYLRFRLPPFSGAVTRATLRLLPATSSRRRLVVRAVPSNRWGERRIAHGRVPRSERIAIRSGKVEAERWLSIDVTAALDRLRRTVSFEVSAGGAGFVRLYSRQAGRDRAPRLVLRTAAEGAVGTDPVIAAAGDIACDPRSRLHGTADSCRDRETAELLADMDLDAVLTLGDNQYEDGRLEAFRAVYDRSWGRFRNVTWPAVGNHEYLTPGASGYFDYFNGVGRSHGRAGERGRGYYSFDVGAWHVIALNSVCAEVGGCDEGSPQERWLRADLAAHPARCTLAYWHHPRFSSGEQSSSTRFTAFWEALHEAGADVVLAGHAHDYERFAPLTPEGEWDPERGIREFVVGTGGKHHYGFGTAEPFSEARDSTTWGVLALTLRGDGYDWRFVPEAGATFTDAGSAPCHD